MASRSTRGLMNSHRDAMPSSPSMANCWSCILARPGRSSPSPRSRNTENWPPAKPCVTKEPASMPSPHEITELLHQWSDGQEEVLEKLIPFIYPELHRMAMRVFDRNRRSCADDGVNSAQPPSCSAC